MKRRENIKTLLAMGLLSSFDWARLLAMDLKNIQTRIIPSSKEALPVIGVGTWQTFDVGLGAPELPQLKEVLRLLLEKGGKVIDSSPMYGRSEQVIGHLTSEEIVSKQLFMASKVWVSGKDQGIVQMNESMKKMGRTKMELMQVHNLLDWKTHLTTLRNWKSSGKIKYLGITHYHHSAYSKIEQLLKNEPLDFLQINYSILEREASDRILPLAQEKGVAVLNNRPFGGGGLFSKVKNTAVPAWAKEFDCTSWGQFFLKFNLSHPAITCAIPGTSKPKHMVDNLGAGYGLLPTERHRQKMIQFIDQL